MGKLQKEQDAFKDALVRDFNTKAAEDDEARSTSAGSPRSSKQLEEGVEGASVFGDQRSEYSQGTSRRSMGAERYNADGRPEWDSSTACGDERLEADHQTKAAAEMILESAPQIRAVHSKGSVQK